MSAPTPGSDEWLDLVVEEIIDPDREIIDPHHHLWRQSNGTEYLLEDLHKDTGSGHNIVKTVFVECHAEYLTTGPKEERSLGETAFVREQAQKSAQGSGAEIAAIVGHADLTLGSKLADVLAKHIDIGAGLFRGIRHAGAREPYPESLTIVGMAPEGLFANEAFRAGMRLLGEMNLTYESWHYHHQNRDFAELARACPDTRMILDHFGTPLGVGRYESQREEIFNQWKHDIRDIAKCPNVVAKLGGMAMPDNGFGWHTRERPVSSDEFVAAQRRYYLHTIECFGPERCMMESNFPVDRMSVSYRVLYNGLKKIVADFSADEQHAMFYGTAAGTYDI